MLGLASCGLCKNETVHFMISLTHINDYSFDLLCVQVFKASKNCAA